MAQFLNYIFDMLANFNSAFLAVIKHMPLSTLIFFTIALERRQADFYLEGLPASSGGESEKL